VANPPDYFKIYIKKEDLHNAYESARIGLISCEKNYLHNPEIYNESLTALKGELIAEMTLAESTHLLENLNLICNLSGGI
jgi:hypothetical protein